METIELNGKTYHVLFGALALAALAKEEDDSLEDLTFKICYNSIKYGQKVAGESFKLSYADFLQEFNNDIYGATNLIQVVESQQSAGNPTPPQEQKKISFAKQSEEMIKMLLGVIGIDYQTYISLTLREISLLIEGYKHRRELISNDFRALYGLYYNSKSKKAHQKPVSRLWKLPTLDGEINGPSGFHKLIQTKWGCVQLLEDWGFQCEDWDDIPDDDIKQIRSIYWNKIRYKSERKEAVKVIKPLLEQHKIKLPKKINIWLRAHLR